MKFYAVRRGIVLPTPCVRCIPTLDAVRNQQRDRLQTFSSTKSARSSVRSRTAQPASRNPSHFACTTKPASKDDEKALKSIPSPRGLLFLKRTAFELKQVFHICAPCPSLNHYTTPVLSLKRCERMSSLTQGVRFCFDRSKNVSN